MMIAGRFGRCLWSLRSLGVALSAAAATRSPAAARSCRRTSRSSACRSFTNSTPVFDIEQRVTEQGARRADRPRASTRSSPTRPASTPCSPARSPSIMLDRRSLFNQQSAGDALRADAVGQGRVPGPQERQGALGEPGAAVPRGVRAGHDRQRSATRPRSSARTPTRSTAWPPSSRASVVSAILEAF